MRISEIFYSIQGEGELTGVPSVFIRTSGCNLRCRWCDTKYASWDPEGEDLSMEQILQKVRQRPAGHCVVTGGEPMVAREIRELLGALKEAGYHLTIETAATVPPEGIACDLASLSPKLKNSTPLPSEIGSGWIERHEASRWQPDVVRAWIDHYPYQLKFVVSSAADMAEIEAVIGELDRKIPSHRILLMPEGLTPEQTHARDEDLVRICKEKGYRFCPRLHLDLFGNTRGT